MEKIKVQEQIYIKTFDNEDYQIKYSDLPNNIQDDDIIEINREHGNYEGSDVYNGFTELVIIRTREETDDEYELRLEDKKKWDKELKRRRYNNYLKLKKEFK